MFSQSESDSYRCNVVLLWNLELQLGPDRARTVHWPPPLRRPDPPSVPSLMMMTKMTVKMMVSMIMMMVMPMVAMITVMVMPIVMVMSMVRIKLWFEWAVPYPLSSPPDAYSAPRGEKPELLLFQPIVFFLTNLFSFLAQRLQNSFLQKFFSQ